MQYSRALLEEHPSDEQSAVAVLGILLCAHHRNPQHFDPMAKSLKPPSECCGARDRVVAHVTVLIVEVIVCRSATELAPKEDVLHAGCVQRVDEWLAVEPRRIARGWPRADVGDALNLLCAQQCQEVLQVVVRVPHCE
jgi:hypothetical protein